MKRSVALLVVLTCFLSSCVTKRESKINISLDLNSYEINDTTAVEKIRRVSILKDSEKDNLVVIDSSFNIFPNPIVDEIKHDEYFTIIYSSGMCFRMVNTKCVFKKMDSKIYCIFGGDFSVELNKEQIEKVRQLEFQLFQINRFKSIKGGDCSDTDKEYTFYAGKKKRTYHYDSCDDRNLLKLLIDGFSTNGKRIKN